MEQLRTLLLWRKRIWINYIEAGGISFPGPDGDSRSEGSSATPCAVPIPYKLTPKAPRTRLETSSAAGKKQLAASAGMKQVVEPVRKETKAPASCIPDAAPRAKLYLAKQPPSKAHSGFTCQGWITGWVLPSPWAASVLCPAQTAFTARTSLTSQMPPLSPTAHQGDGERTHGGVRDR